MVEISDEQIMGLKQKGLTCSKIRASINKQLNDAKNSRRDAGIFKNFGINSQAELQEKIANSEEQSARFLMELRKKLCPLK